MSNLSQNPELSFVIPCYNEVDSLEQLFLEISQEAQKLGLSFEILAINDGSSDGTLSKLKELKSRNTNLKIFSLQKNFGKANALSIGFTESKGEIVFTMDADLQDNPVEIKNFLAKIQEGWDVVSGWKENRHDPIEKRLPSKLFNKVVSFFSGVKLHDFNCGFKAYRKRVVKSIVLTGEMHRYIPVLASFKGFTVTEIPVLHRARSFGKSKYGIGRYFKGFLDFVTIFFLMNYARKPMHFFGLIGLISLFSGIFSLTYLGYLWFLGQSVGDRPLLLISVFLIMLGVQFGFTGILAEILSNPAFEDKKVYYQKY